MCNLQETSAAIEAWNFKAKYPYQTHATPSSEKPCDIRFISAKLPKFCYFQYHQWSQADFQANWLPRFRHSQPLQSIAFRLTWIMLSNIRWSRAHFLKLNFSWNSFFFSILSTSYIRLLIDFSTFDSASHWNKHWFPYLVFRQERSIRLYLRGLYHIKRLIAWQIPMVQNKIKYIAYPSDFSNRLLYLDDMIIISYTY